MSQRPIHDARPPASVSGTPRTGGKDSEARRFLEALFSGKPDGLYLLLWTLADKRSRWFHDIDAAASAVEALAQQDVYVGVGLAARDYGPARGCPSEEIGGLAGFWADLELSSEAHQKKALPATIQDALTIIAEPLSPTMVIATGNEAHAWWLFKEPYVFADGEERKGAARLVARWHTLLRLTAAARGWAFDRLSDLARVLRIPDTLNTKDPAKPNLSPSPDSRDDFQKAVTNARVREARVMSKSCPCESLPGVTSESKLPGTGPWWQFGVQIAGR
jgi:hypothetical protein